MRTGLERRTAAVGFSRLHPVVVTAVAKGLRSETHSSPLASLVNRPPSLPHP